MFFRDVEVFHQLRNFLRNNWLQQQATYSNGLVSDVKNVL